jgi:hypothetical protein
MTTESDDDMIEYESQTPIETMADYLMTFLKCVGIFAVICFAIGYFTDSKAQTKQCEPSKTVLARSIFK